jgi:hypothetical protein
MRKSLTDDIEDELKMIRVVSTGSRCSKQLAGTLTNDTEERAANSLRNIATRL